MTTSFASVKLNGPSNALVTTNIRLQIGELPLGVRVPPVYTVTVATPSTGQSVVVGVAAVVGATTLTVTSLGSSLPAFSILTLGGSGAVVTSAAAASGATTITVYPINFEIAANTAFTYDTGALTIGSTMIAVSALPVVIDVGTILTFGAQSVIVTGRSPAGAVQLRVSALTTALVAGNSAATKGLYTVYGCTSSPVPSPEPKVVDTTNLLSGIGMEAKITAIKQTMAINFNVIAGDLGGGLLVDILRNKQKYNREFYFEVLLDYNELHTGAAIVTAGPESGEIQDLRKIAATAQVQGDSYSYNKPNYVFF